MITTVTHIRFSRRPVECARLYRAVQRLEKWRELRAQRIAGYFAWYFLAVQAIGWTAYLFWHFV